MANNKKDLNDRFFENVLVDVDTDDDLTEVQPAPRATPPRPRAANPQGPRPSAPKPKGPRPSTPRPNTPRPTTPRPQLKNLKPLSLRSRFNASKSLAVAKQYLRIWQNKASVLFDDARLWSQRMVNRARAQPRPFIMIGAGLAGIVLIVVVLWSGVLSGLFAAPTIADLQREVKENPQDAEARLLLGHALFSEGQPDRALRAYSKALDLDDDIADTKLVDNLVETFGTKARNRAANLITKHKLTDAEDQLRDFLGHKRRSVRAKAMRTLEKIGKATRSDRISFYTQDLNLKNCNIRLRAVAKLGVYGDKQVIPALKAADKKDKDETPWYRSSCLGDSVEAAVKKIRKRH